MALTILHEHTWIIPATICTVDQEYAIKIDINTSSRTIIN